MTDTIYELSIIINSSHARYFFKPFWTSLNIALKELDTINFEIIVLLENDEKLIKDIVNNCVIAKAYQNIQFVHTAQNDNWKEIGLNLAKGKSIAFLNGFDLISKNYFNLSTVKDTKHTVYLPEYIIYFDEGAYILELNDYKVDNLITLGTFLTGSKESLRKIYQGYDLSSNSEIPFKINKNAIYFARLTENLNTNNNLLLFKAQRPRNINEINQDIEKSSSHNINLDKNKPSRFKNKLKQINAIIFNKNLANTQEKLTGFNQIPSQIDQNKENFLINEWKAIHELEPITFPANWIFKQYKKCLIPDSRMQECYSTLLDRYPKHSEYLFIIPSLNIGGADIVAINYINFLNANAKKVTVLTVDKTESKWQSKLDPKVTFIELGNLFCDLDYISIKMLLLKLIINLRPPKIHNINCLMAYELFNEYGKIIALKSRLFISIFAYGINAQGRKGGYLVYHLRNVFDYVSAVFTDNKTIIDYCVNTLGLDAGKFYTHYQSVKSINNQAKEFNYLKNLKVVWASRLVPEKKIDVLYDVLKQTQDLPLAFFIYGNIDNDNIEFLDKLKELKNVSYMGSYNDFSQISSQNYDLFLYTSNWDGLPNVILEAMATGLIVIAPDVGGIKEVIDNLKNGFIIDNDTSENQVSKYVDIFKRITNKEFDLSALRNSALAKIQNQHSCDTFGKAIKNSGTYF